MGVPSRNPEPVPRLDRGLKDAAAAGAGPAGDRQHPPTPELDAAVIGPNDWPVGRQGRGLTPAARAARGHRQSPGSCCGAMAVPSPGPREVGADPGENRRGQVPGPGSVNGVDPPHLRRSPGLGENQQLPLPFPDHQYEWG